MKFGSVCSGIEAASVAFEPLGWKAAWFSEIEPFPCAVLKHHYPDIPNHGDMTTLPGKIKSGEVEAPDLFCGGTPCQAFSVAGLRQSLSDDRGNLSLTFCEIANAIDDVRLARGEPPAIVFWENVPGVLSTQDNAFGCFLGALSGCDSPILPGRLGWTDAGVVAGPQRTVAWRVLDAQYFGLAQRRRRVFVVASARDGFNPAEVLLEFHGLRRDIAPSREAGERPTGSIVARTGRNGGASNQDVNGGMIALCLNAKGGVGRLDAESETLIPTIGRFDVAGCEFGPSGGKFVDVNPTLDARAKDGPIRNQLAGAVLQSVAHTLRGEGFDASEDGTGRGTPLVPVAFHPTQDPISSQDVCHAIGANENATAAVMRPIPYSIMPMNSGKDYKAREVEVAQPLMAGGPVGGNQGGDFIVQPISLQDVRGVEKAQNGKGWNDDGTAYTVDTHATQGVAFDSYNLCETGDLTQTLKSPQGGVTESIGGVRTGMQVRRLTPMECERLQGFPDGYTNIPWRGKPESPDGPRYKALGNSWAVPCVQWIGRRIQQEVQGKVPS